MDFCVLTLNPVPGFCVKSKATNNAVVVHRTASVPPTETPAPIHVRSGLKVFVNIAWDANIPPPPTASEETIDAVLQGLDVEDDAWFVPMLVSDARQDSDKGISISDGADSFISIRALAGQPAIVFDCVFNPGVKSRMLTHPSFRGYIIEIAFQHVETQTSLVLSRQIGTPNIASKGKPRAGQVRVPVAMCPPGLRRPDQRSDGRPTSTPTKLIQEIDDRASPDRSISTPNGGGPHLPSATARAQMPAWTWTEEGSRIRIVIQVPAVSHAIIPESTLDVEPKRVLLHVPSVYDLDINLEASDAELCSMFAANVDKVLQLKRKRDLDVDKARAEWRVADKAIVLVA